MMPQRRDFLKMLAALPLAGLANVHQRDQRTTYLLNECFVAGFRFHDGRALLERMSPGDSLALVAEPSNVHDRFAVRMDFGDRPIGYLPKNQNQPVSRLLQQGAPVECRICRVSAEAKPWEAVTVQVSITVDGPA